MKKEEILNTFLLANIPEIITQEEFDDVKKAIKQLQQENQELKKIVELYSKSLYNAELTKYKEVIDKAIEWVYMVQQNKDNKHLEPIICTDELDELLDILKGSEINEC